MFMQMSGAASWVCTDAWTMGMLRIFANIDFQCTYHYQRTSALVILFQHFDKDGELRY